MGPPPGAATTNPVFAGVALVAGAAAVLLAVGAAVTGWDLLLWSTALSASGAAMVLALSGAGRDAARRVHVDGDRITVRLRRIFPVTASLFVATLSAFFASHATAEAFSATTIPTALLALAGVALLPDLVRAAVIRTHVTVDPHTIRLRSWACEASVDWTDVTGVGLGPGVPASPPLVIHTRADAPSLVVRRQRLLVPLEPRPPLGQIVVSSVPLDEPWLLAGRLDTLVGLSVATRRSQLLLDTATLLTPQRRD